MTSSLGGSGREDDGLKKRLSEKKSAGGEMNCLVQLKSLSQSLEKIGVKGLFPRDEGCFPKGFQPGLMSELRKEKTKTFSGHFSLEEKVEPGL